MTAEAFDAVRALPDVDGLRRLGRTVIECEGGVEAAVGRLVLALLELTDGTLTVGEAEADGYGNAWGESA